MTAPQPPAAWPTAMDLDVVRAEIAHAVEHVARLRGLALCDAVERLTAQGDIDEAEATHLDALLYGIAAHVGVAEDDTDDACAAAIIACFDALTAQRDAAARVVAAHDRERAAEAVLHSYRTAKASPRDWSAAYTERDAATAELAAARAAYTAAMEAT